MAKVSIVIGANYGDEGKGNVVSWLAMERDPVWTYNVKHNGGAQAGHTVHYPYKGSRVFHQLGSATLAGAITFMADSFIVNPVLLYTEWESFKTRSLVPRISAAAKMTTHLDIKANQMRERERAKRHGSCGMGIHETIMRDPYVGIRVADCLWGKKRFLKKLAMTSIHYTGQFTDFLGDVNKEAEEMEQYWTYCRWLADTCEIVPFDRRPDAIESQHTDVIFEGGQGLALDQDAPRFPHLTHSKTGLHEPVRLIKQMGLADREIEVFYVTRSYLTRHGAGPLPHESDEWPRYFRDETNKPNDWQGSLRFAPLDIDLMFARIEHDLHSLAGLRPKVSLVVTCMDQWGGTKAMPDDMRFITRYIDVPRDGWGFMGAIDKYHADLCARRGLEGRILTSWGPCGATDIRPWNPRRDKKILTKNTKGFSQLGIAQGDAG